MRNKAEIIHQAKRWANRRTQIIKHIWGRETWRPEHFFAKNKIHCSCPMCSTKTNTSGWKHSDKKRILDEDFD